MAHQKKPHQLGEELRKCDAKLRVIANGAEDVNIVRAERCDAIRVGAGVALAKRKYSMEVVAEGESTQTPARGHIDKPSSSIYANVFITTVKPDGKALPGVTRSNGRLATATIPLSKLRDLIEDDSVRQVSLGQGLNDPDPVRLPGTPDAPRAADRRVKGEAHHAFGQDTLVGIIDVQGFDFAHPDFLDGNGQTRFEAIWDQGAEADGTAKAFKYGRVITKAKMNGAIRSGAQHGVPATELEPQTAMDTGSHGTHVASIAAGNLGVARKAKIAAVLISLGPEDLDRRRSFYDSTRLAHAVDWLLDLGEKMNLPVSINVSLGTNGHAHDSSAPVNRWIDERLATPGRSVCVAAGNAGQEKAESSDDIGFVMGRIHTEGKIPAANLDADIEWIVAGSGKRDYSENELELWFSPQDQIAVTVREPSGVTHGPVAPREFIENRKLADGCFLSVYNDLYHPANGANYIGVFLSPNFRASPIVGIPAGMWVVRLHGVDVRDGRYNGWIERDDPDPLPGDPEAPPRWRFPSFFSEKSNVDRSSISTLACGHRVVGVGNLDARLESVNITSSQGPTREGRQKPDIAARGTDVVAANGFAGASDPWIAMTGTSMASPYVCGVVALMLRVRPELTAAQVIGILQRTARPLPGKDFTWQDDAGFGRIDADACIDEARNIHKREDRT